MLSPRGSAFMLPSCAPRRIAPTSPTLAPQTRWVQQRLLLRQRQPGMLLHPRPHLRCVHSGIGELRTSSWRRSLPFQGGSVSPPRAGSGAALWPAVVP